MPPKRGCLPDNTGLVPPDPNLRHEMVLQHTFLEVEGQDLVLYQYWEITRGPSRAWMFLTKQSIVKR